MQFLKQSTAASLIVGPILDSAGAEYASAVIGDLSLSKNGGTLTALASAATLTHISNGLYTLALTTGNTDTLGHVEIFCTKSTYQMPPVRFTVLNATTFDALVTNAAGAANGMMLCGSNAATTFATLTSTGAFTCGSTVLGNTTAGTLATSGTTTFNALTVTNATTLSGALAVTGALTIGDGIAVNCSTTNRDALALQANGTGIGVSVLGGSTGVSIDGLSGNGMNIFGDAGVGLYVAGTGASGHGVQVDAGSTSAVGLKITGGTSSGAAITLAATSGAATIPADLQTIKTQAVTCSGGVTVPAATLASTDNITAGTVTTVTNLTNLPAITANWLTAAGLAADAVAEIQAGLSTLDAAAVRTAVGLASANLDTQLAAIAGYIDTEVGAIYARLGAPAGASLAADVAAVKADSAAILDDTGTSGVVVASGSKTGYSLAAAGLDAVVIETGVNARQALSLLAAAEGGVLAGAATSTITIKGAGVATTRVTATVDSDGNRSAVTLNLPS